MKKYEAKIIGETSAGMTGLEIYVNGELYWSNNYFENGATQSYYKEGLRQIFDDAMACDEVESWAEFEYDEENNRVVEQLDNYDTTWVVASYTPENGWNFEEPCNDGQSADFIAYNKDRIPADVVEAWENR